MAPSVPWIGMHGSQIVAFVPGDEATLRPLPNGDHAATIATVAYKTPRNAGLVAWDLPSGGSQSPTESRPWRTYQRHYGRNQSPILVRKGNTRSMNPVVDRAVIEEAYEADPLAAAAEYGAEFRRDVEAFMTPEALDAVTVPGRYELAPLAASGYVAFVDPSDGRSRQYDIGDRAS